MKKSNYFINGIFILAVTGLFFLQCTGKDSNTKHAGPVAVGADSAGYHLPVAYVRTDSLLPKYKYFNDLNETLIKKAEDKKLDLNKKADRWSKDVADFQQKAQMNAFISRERQDQEQDRLLRQKQDLDNQAAQADKEMQTEQMKMIQLIQDTIISALKQFNTPKKYELIFSNSGTDNILYADDSYDITNEVLEFLNARYVPSK